MKLSKEYYLEDRESVLNRVKHYLNLKSEGPSWDFKREWHHDEASLLHDIICMANNLTDEDGLIIIGIDEANDFAVTDVVGNSGRRDTQHLVTFLRDKKFAGGVRPEARVESFDFGGRTIDVIVVSNTSDVPYYLSSDFKNGLKANSIYTRVGDTNTPRDKSADRDKIEKLWRRHFGIDKTAIERFQLYLKDYKNWESADGEQSWYYKIFPEFRLETERDDSRDGYEYYCFSQIDPRPIWYNLHLKCSGTILQDFSAIALDGARFFTASPQMKVLNLGRDEVLFYFVKGTLEYDLNNFFLHNSVSIDQFSVHRWYECIPVFVSEEEKNDFFYYLQQNGIRPYQGKAFLVPDKLQNGEDPARYRRQYPDALSVVEMLEDYRLEQSGD